MKSTIKEHLVSLALTFLSGFAVYMAFLIQTPNFQFTKDALGSAGVAAIIAGVRAVAKLIIEWDSEPQA